MSFASDYDRIGHVLVLFQTSNEASEREESLSEVKRKSCSINFGYSWKDS